MKYHLLLCLFLLLSSCETPQRVPSSLDKEKETKYPHEPINHLEPEIEIEVASNS